MIPLTILCVTKAERHAMPFIQYMNAMSNVLGAEFVVAADGDNAIELLRYEHLATVFRVKSDGYIESVLDDAVDFCHGDYILRLDDDEKASPAMIAWLMSRDYLTSDHWKFPRMALWPKAHSYIVDPPLWPDHQTRLSIKAKSGGRHHVHAGSPFGGGQIAPCAIEHHKFIVRSYKERLAIAQIYDREMPGGGTGGMLPFNLPEDAFALIHVESVHDCVPA